MKPATKTTKAVLWIAGIACIALVVTACNDGDDVALPPITQPALPPITPIQPAPPPVTQPAPPPVTQPAPPPVQGRGSRLAAVRERGTVICGGRNDTAGFAFLDADGRSDGFDIALCRAVAAAVLGDPQAIELRVVDFSGRAVALQTGVIDMLSLQTTWTTLRDVEWGDFVPTMFYDGQGFMVRRALNVTSVFGLSNTTVCVTEGTTTLLNVNDFSRENGLNLTPLTFPTQAASEAAYVSGVCSAVTSDRSALASILSGFQDPTAHVVLPETISEEPLGPVVPHGDGLWFDIVKTVMSMLIYAEAYDVTAATVPTTMPTGDVETDRLFGLEGTYGQASLSLSQTAAQDVIRAVGNYGELYTRYLGPNGLNLPRENSRNALWSSATCAACPKGGQIYAAPPR